MTISGKIVPFLPVSLFGSSAIVPTKVLPLFQTNQNIMPKNERGVKCQSKVFKIVGKTAADCQYTFASGLHVIQDQGYSEHSQDKNGSYTWNVGFFLETAFFFWGGWLIDVRSGTRHLNHTHSYANLLPRPEQTIHFHAFSSSCFFRSVCFLLFQNVGIFWLHKFAHISCNSAPIFPSFLRVLAPTR